jgi:hypothetical protein
MRATLSREKKYEIAFAALTNRFVGESRDGLLKFKPENKLGLDGFYEKSLVVATEDYKNDKTKRLIKEKLEMNILNSESVNQLTQTTNGQNFVNDYNMQVKDENSKNGNTFEPIFNAFRDQILVMYTLKAQNNLFSAYTKNLTELQHAGILDNAFVSEIVADLFPNKNWSVEEVKAKTVDNTTQEQAAEEITA